MEASFLPLLLLLRHSTIRQELQRIEVSYSLHLAVKLSTLFSKHVVTNRLMFLECLFVEFSFTVLALMQLTLLLEQYLFNLLESHLALQINLSFFSLLLYCKKHLIINSTLHLQLFQIPLCFLFLFVSLLDSHDHSNFFLNQGFWFVFT